MTATLTDRYIAATVRTLPPHLQDEVRDELRASITDAVDARTDAGQAFADAERAVLTELGDPGILAAGYADRPLHLIGPRYYLPWWRLLKVLLAIVPACAFGGVALGHAVSGSGLGTIIGQAVVAALTTIVHVSFWTTLVFVILERSGADTGVRWRVDDLPDERPAGVGRVDLVASLVLLGLLAGALIWDRFIGLTWIDGRWMPILDPALWPWWTGLVLVVLAGEAALAIAVHIRRGWTVALAVTNTVLAAAVLVLGLWALLANALFAPDFADRVLQATDADAVTVLGALTGIGIVGFSVWDAVDGWLKLRRARVTRSRRPRRFAG